VVWRDGKIGFAQGGTPHIIDLKVGFFKRGAHSAADEGGPTLGEGRCARPIDIVLFARSGTKRGLIRSGRGTVLRFDPPPKKVSAKYKGSVRVCAGANWGDGLPDRNANYDFGGRAVRRRLIAQNRSIAGAAGGWGEGAVDKPRGSRLISVARRERGAGKNGAQYMVDPRRGAASWVGGDAQCLQSSRCQGTSASGGNCSAKSNSRNAFWAIAGLSLATRCFRRFSVRISPARWTSLSTLSRGFWTEGSNLLRLAEILPAPRLSAAAFVARELPAVCPSLFLLFAITGAAPARAKAPSATVIGADYVGQIHRWEERHCIGMGRERAFERRSGGRGPRTGL